VSLLSRSWQVLFIRPGTRRANRPAQLRCERLEARDVPDARTVNVMTQNLYLGADINPAIAAVATGNPAIFIPAVSQFWANVRATNFLERAGAIAAEIAAAQPDLVGLQEAELYRTGPALNPAPATHVELDFVQVLLDRLATRGQHYAVVAAVNNFDAEVPAFTSPGVLQDLRLTDRDVLLARTDLPPGQFRVSNAQAHNFVATLVLPFATGPFAVPRGWVSADVTTRGRTVRVVSTHLDPISPLVQVAQAAELVAGPAHTPFPVVLIGDFNSPADPTSVDATPTYAFLRGAGLRDAWVDTHPGDLGYTWGQAPNLLNAVSSFTERLDLVLFRGDAQAFATDIVGDAQSDRTPSGLWPSDHGGVTATLGIYLAPAVGPDGGNVKAFNLVAGPGDSVAADNVFVVAAGTSQVSANAAATPSAFHPTVVRDASGPDARDRDDYRRLANDASGASDRVKVGLDSRLGDKDQEASASIPWRSTRNPFLGTRRQSVHFGA
jgi:endonuclease/exonuclease/phosphatase family metal-dependent hydrolase